MTLPKLASLAGAEPASVDAVLASYDHSNTVNLFALGALVAWLRGEVAAEGTPEQGPRLPAPDVALPQARLRRPTSSPETWQLVLRLNHFGDRPAAPDPRQHVSPSRPCAAPSCAARGGAGAGQADGSLGRAIAANRGGCRSIEQVVLARAIGATAGAGRARSRAGVSAFVDHAIGKMVTICRAIRVARACDVEVRL